MGVTFDLLKKSPLILKFYLDSIAFPLVMENNGEMMFAFGQDLGGDMLFGRRPVGFIGTPSDLLLEELVQMKVLMEISIIT